jgi:hypothetical protein
MTQDQTRDDTVRGEIVRLEQRIEALQTSIERCRKVSLLAKCAAAGGCGFIALVLLTVVPFAPPGFFAAVSLAIGGVVLLGSNATTWRRMQSDLDAAQAARNRLIGMLDLHAIDPHAAGPQTIPDSTGHTLH